MMLTFKQFLSEALMTFGPKAYPKFGNIVILAGGAGSGKGFQKDNLLGIEGINLDVDALKELAAKAPKFIEKIKSETGRDISKLDMKNPKDVSQMHYVLNDVYQIPDKKQGALFGSIVLANPERKPNLIFDVTLKDMSKLVSIATAAEDLGYDKKNIHIVWVVNEVNIAMEQNKARKRTVPEEILFATHQGAALTMKRVLDMGDNLKQYMDGAIYISFNKIHTDVTTVKSGRPGASSALPGRKGNGSYIKESNYFLVKRQGHPQLHSSELDSQISAKIKSYVPIW